MVVGVDIGGTKTLIGVFAEEPTPLRHVRFETPKKYTDFLMSFEQQYRSLELAVAPNGCAVAVPAYVDRTTGTALRFGNLAWKNVPIQADIERIVGCKTVIENDANAAGLAETLERGLLKETVLYITISTGIGTGIIDNGVVDKTLEDSEGGSMLLPYNGSLQIWEKFGSGKAIYEAYGKKASEIHDPKIWQDIVERWWVGFVELCSVVQPDLIVIGGGVGSHFEKYGELLVEKIQQNLPPMAHMPDIEQAKNAEGAALLGAYYLAKRLTGAASR